MTNTINNIPQTVLEAAYSIKNRDYNLTGKGYFDAFGKDCYDAYLTDKRLASRYEQHIVNNLIAEWGRTIDVRHSRNKWARVNAMYLFDRRYRTFIKLFEEEYGISIFNEDAFLRDMSLFYPDLFGWRCDIKDYM